MRNTSKKQTKDKELVKDIISIMNVYVAKCNTFTNNRNFLNKIF
jgi:predicted site-specific integrase-resolvase